MALTISNAGAAPNGAAAPSTTGAVSGSSTSSSDTDVKAMAFQYILSAALNAPDVLGGADGASVDDDDDDGSNLTVKMGA